MEDDSRREDIADRVAFGLHILDVDDLGSHESWGSASHKKVFLFFSVGSQSEITDADFEAVLPFEHDIFGFEVSVNDAFFC